MKKDAIFNKKNPWESDFEFNDKVAEVFDDMVDRSIPYYHEVQRMSASLLLYYYEAERNNGNMIYDLGSSTGSMASVLSKIFGERELYYTGIDNSFSMIQISQKREFPDYHKIEFLNENILDMEYNNTFAFIAHYTIQFLRPLQRLPFLRKLKNSLPPGGIFLMSEKVLENNSGYSRAFQKLYYDYKKENGYSSLEISSKREALENVLIPYRTDENIAMLYDAGFDYVDLYFKWFNFASFIAIKKP